MADLDNMVISGFKLKDLPLFLQADVRKLLKYLEDNKHLEGWFDWKGSLVNGTPQLVFLSSHVNKGIELPECYIEAIPRYRRMKELFDTMGSKGKCKAACLDVELSIRNDTPTFVSR